MLAAVIPTIYYLSAVPVERVVMHRTRGETQESLCQLVEIVYFPVLLTVDVPVLRELLYWESDMMDSLLGPPGIPTDRIEDVVPLLVPDL